MAVSIQRIRAAEWGDLRDVRLRSLLDSPGAFGQRYEDAESTSDEEWRSTARASASGDRRTWFVARDASGSPVGVVQARRRPPADCLLFSMWVAPTARRLGIGARLVEAVSDWATGWNARRIVLWVIATNEGAARFYERIGFRALDAGPDAESGRAYGALAMERPTAQPPD